jgi:hypothetical protein
MEGRGNKEGKEKKKGKKKKEDNDETNGWGLTLDAAARYRDRTHRQRTGIGLRAGVFQG